MVETMFAAEAIAPLAGDTNRPNKATDAMLVAIDAGAYLLQANRDLEQGHYEDARRMMAQALQKFDELVEHLRQFEKQQQQTQS